jgi:hypothetical protein
MVAIGSVSGATLTILPLPIGLVPSGFLFSAVIGIHHAFLRTWFLFNPCSIVVQQKAPARASRAGAGG